MFKWADAGSYFSANDVRQSNVPTYTNLADNPEVQMYADITKTKLRSDLIRDTFVYIHGSNSSTAYPYFEFTNVNDMPLIIKFKMRLTLKNDDVSQIGNYDYFFMTDDSNATLGAIGIKYLTVKNHASVPVFIDNSGVIEYPLSEFMKERQWFNVEILYFDNILYFKVNERIINSIDWSGDIEKWFRLKIQGNHFYFDYADIVITKIEYLIREIPFEVFISQSDVVNGTITLTANHTILE